MLYPVLVDDRQQHVALDDGIIEVFLFFVSSYLLLVALDDLFGTLIDEIFVIPILDILCRNELRAFGKSAVFERGIDGLVRPGRGLGRLGYGRSHNVGNVVGDKTENVAVDVFAS